MIETVIKILVVLYRVRSFTIKHVRFIISKRNFEKPFSQREDFSYFDTKNDNYPLI